MKRTLLTMAVMAAAVAAIGQTELNENGIYEAKVVKEYEGVGMGVLFDRTLVALSEIKGGGEFSKFNFDVKEKDGGIIVYKGTLLVGYRKVNFSGGYEFLADLTLKIRLKDGKAQYTATVPTMTLTWQGHPEITDQMPLTDILPEVNYKGHLYYTKKGLQEFAPKIAPSVMAFIDRLAAKTAAVADDDF